MENENGQGLNRYGRYWCLLRNTHISDWQRTFDSTEEILEQAEKFSAGIEDSETRRIFFSHYLNQWYDLDDENWNGKQMEWNVSVVFDATIKNSKSESTSYLWHDASGNMTIVEIDCKEESE